MSHVTGYSPGRFCWVDLNTTDPAAATAFYTQLFGWTSNDVPMGEGRVYTILQKGGHDAAALSDMMPDQQAQGVPPHWNCYVSVDDADATAAGVPAAGGTVLAPAMDVFDNGRVAVFADPNGAIVCVWQPGKHIGAMVVNEPSAMCWHELLTTDRPKAREFYRRVFGWESKGDEGDYTEFLQGGESFAGMMTIRPEWGPMPPNWGVYFMVGNCDESAEKALALGATVYVPPTDIPGTGRFATLADPQGAAFSIFHPTM